MRRTAGLVITAALLVAAPALAQAAPAPSAEHRLSPEQIEAVLAEAAKKRETAELQLTTDPGMAVEEAPRPRVHGDVGFAVGTGGYREVFGTGIYPLGDDGVAAISMDFVDWGKRRDRR